MSADFECVSRGIPPGWQSRPTAPEMVRHQGFPWLVLLCVSLHREWESLRPGSPAGMRPDAPQRFFYSSTYRASGLPAGLALNASTGQITGTPTAAGISNVTVTVTATDGTGAFREHRVLLDRLPAGPGAEQDHDGVLGGVRHQLHREPRH